MRVMLATDGSAASLNAVDRWIEAARLFAEPVELVLVTVHPAVPLAFATRHIEEETLEHYYSDEGQAALEPAAEKLRGAGLAFQSHVLIGPPAETLVSYAADGGFDWIWLGARGHSLVERLLVGSVASRVVQTAHCPVMVAR